MYSKFIFIGLCVLISFFETKGQNRLVLPGSLPFPNTNIQPLYFTENAGQIKDQYGNPRPDIDVKLRDKGITLFVGKGKLQYQLERRQAYIPLSMPQEAADADLLETYRVELRLTGANPNAVLEKQDEMALPSHYYGTGMPETGYKARAYQKLCYKNVYPNIDWVIYVKEEGIEHDFIVHPGARVSDIEMEYLGAEQISWDNSGGLTIYTPLGTIQESSPITYQEDGTLIPSTFLLDSNKIRLATPGHKCKITLDPKVNWGTYLGGTYLGDEVISVVNDSKGNLYCSGQTTSSNIATTGAFKNTISGLFDAFLCKFDADGKQIWGTYFGGPGTDRGWGLAIDSQDNLYLHVHCMDGAPGLATLGAYQTAPRGGKEIVLAKFNENGERVWSTYYGGSKDEGSNSIFNTLQVHGTSLYLYATTSSSDNIASPGAEKTVLNGKENIFLAKFDLNGQRIWSTYIQGMDSTGLNVQTAFAMNIDPKGNIYMSTHAEKKGWSTGNSHQPDPSLGSDAVLLKYDTAGKRIWSTYYGGEKYDVISSIACDQYNNVYVAGYTLSSNNIATPGSLQPNFSGGGLFDFFVAKFDESGKRIWGSYLGGDGTEGMPKLNIVGNQYILLNGTTTSTNMPVTEKAFQKTFGGGTGNLNWGDWYVAQFDLSFNLIWSSYYGGSGDQMAYSSSISGADVYLCGNSYSSNGVVTPGSHLDTLNNPFGGFAGLIVKLCFSSLPEAGYIQGQDSVCADQLIGYTVPGDADIENCIWTLPEGWNGNSTTTNISIRNNGQSGQIGVQIIRCGDTSSISWLPVHVFVPTEAIITIEGKTLKTLHQHSSYQWILDDQAIEGATQSTFTVTGNGHYRVATTDVNGCIDTSEVYVVNNVSIQDNYLGQAFIEVYPNPASTTLYIQAAGSVFTTLRAVDGKTLISKTKEKTICIDGFASGLYLVQVQDEKGNMLYHNKLIKM